MNFPAYQQVENCEKESTLGSAVTPWMLFQSSTLDMGQLCFPLEAERNVFGGFVNLLLTFSTW